MRKGSLIDFNWITQVILGWVLTAFPQVSREDLVIQKQISLYKVAILAYGYTNDNFCRQKQPQNSSIALSSQPAILRF